MITRIIIDIEDHQHHLRHPPRVQFTKKTILARSPDVVCITGLEIRMKGGKKRSQSRMRFLVVAQQLSLRSNKNM